MTNAYTKVTIAVWMFQSFVSVVLHEIHQAQAKARLVLVRRRPAFGQHGLEGDIALPLSSFLILAKRWQAHNW
jgi:hypothetical protein